MAAGSALANDDDKPKTDKSVYSLFNPTPDKDLRDFNPNRPSKITSPFTIDAGRFEIESDFVAYQHTHIDGVTQHAYQLVDPTLTLGITSNIDFEVALNGLNIVREIPDRRPNRARTFSGFGDVYVRTKVNLMGNDDGDMAVAFVPYVKAPAGTAASLALGNDAVEGGGLLTAQFKLPEEFSLGLQTEVDALQGGNDSARHPNFVNIATIGHEVPGIKNLSAYAEFFSSVSADRFTSDIYTADVALAYLIKPSTQFDVGANFGLNKDAPDLQVYAGISQRF